MITQSESPLPEEIEVHKHRRDISVLSSATVKTGLTGGTRASVIPGKLIPTNKNTYKILRFVSIKKGSNSKSG